VGDSTVFDVVTHVVDFDGDFFWMYFCNFRGSVFPAVSD